MNRDLEKQAKLLTELNKVITDAEKPGCADFLLWLTVGLVLSLLIKGWVLSILWGWFMAPLGLPLIGPWHAIGITGILGLMRASASVPAQSKDTNMSTKTGLRNWALLSVVLPLTALFSGWVFHSLM